MPVPKGTNNFFKSDRLRIEKMKIALKSELEKLRKERKIFANESHIGDTLAEELGVNKSTLSRNLEYKSLILNYLEQQQIRGSANSPKASDSVKIAELEIELSNARNEVSVLRRYIEKLNTTVSMAPATKSVPGVENLDFPKTAQVICLLLEAADGQFVLQDGNIINMTKRANNIIAKQGLVAPYLKWLKSQEKFNE